MTATAELVERTQVVPADVIDHPSGYLALSPRNARFSIGGLDGFVVYREQGRHLATFGGVHATPAARGEILDRFLDFATECGRRVVAVQVRNDQTALFRSRGFAVNQFGSTYAVRLGGFSLAGRRRMKLRHKIKQATEARLRVLELGRDTPRDDAVFEELRAASTAWLRAKKKKELDFMIGELGEPADRERRIFTVVGPDERTLGFITYVPAWGSKPGYLHDLTRRVPETPPGAMELCNARAIERFQAEGVEYLHFGFTPFVVDDEEPDGASPLLARAVRLLGRYGSAVYPAQRQVDYKLKWGPEIVEREFIAMRPVSARAVLDLLVLTRSI